MKKEGLEEIKEGCYRIPEGCMAGIRSGILEVRKRKNSVITDDRCRDCRYFSHGHSGKSMWSITTICRKRPKTVKHMVSNHKVFYHINPISKICELFEPKVKEDGDNSSSI